MSWGHSNILNCKSIAIFDIGNSFSTLESHFRCKWLILQIQTTHFPHIQPISGLFSTQAIHIRRNQPISSTNDPFSVHTAFFDPKWLLGHLIFTHLLLLCNYFTHKIPLCIVYDLKEIKIVVFVFQTPTSVPKLPTVDQLPNYGTSAFPKWLWTIKYLQET